MLQICFCSWAYQALTRFCTMQEFVLLIICTFLIIVLCLCHAGCDMTAYMQCFCTCVCFQVFLFLFHCVSFLCVFFLFCGSLWSDSNKERKKKKESYIDWPSFLTVVHSYTQLYSRRIIPCSQYYWHDNLAAACHHQPSTIFPHNSSHHGEIAVYRLRTTSRRPKSRPFLFLR